MEVTFKKFLDGDNQQLCLVYDSIYGSKITQLKRFLCEISKFDEIKLSNNLLSQNSTDNINSTNNSFPQNSSQPQQTPSIQSVVDQIHKIQKQKKIIVTGIERLSTQNFNKLTQSLTVPSKTLNKNSVILFVKRDQLTPVQLNKITKQYTNLLVLDSKEQKMDQNQVQIDFFNNQKIGFYEVKKYVFTIDFGLQKIDMNEYQKEKVKTEDITTFLQQSTFQLQNSQAQMNQKNNILLPHFEQNNVQRIQKEQEEDAVEGENIIQLQDDEVDEEDDMDV